MTDEVKATSRRTIVIGATALALTPLALATTATAGVVTQANAKYQPNPKGPSHCAICNYFLPPAANAKPGTLGACKQVAGAISPNGWCQFYQKKAGAK